VIYVALLRARRTLLWTALAYVAIVAVTVVSFLTHHVTVKPGLDPFGLPDSMFVSAAFVGALIVASVTATSLNREGPTLPIAWTKPQPRARIALEYFAVDLGAVVGVGLLTVAAGVLIALPTGALSHVLHDPNLGELIVRSLGVTFMWYAVVQAASAGLSGRGGAVIGLSWPVFGGLLWLAVADVPGLRPVGLVLNVLNPLAWLSSTTRVQHGVVTSATSSLFPFLPHAVVVVAPWLLAGLALYLATVLWSRREA
jgi:hypothetical protein